MQQWTFLKTTLKICLKYENMDKSLIISCQQPKPSSTQQTILHSLYENT
jgi:hypothetical protein